MDVFRLMNLPDRVIAFEGLPESLLKGFEMCNTDGFPRHWKEWMGKKKRIIPIPPEKDMLTGQVRRYDPIVEEDSFFYLVDWNIQPQVEKWQEVCSYVRSNAVEGTKLLEKITDMAVKLGPDKSSGVELDPSDVPVITLKVKESLVDSKGSEVPRGTIDRLAPKPEKPVIKIKCDECEYEKEGPYAKNSIRMHKQKVHKKDAVAV